MVRWKWKLDSLLHHRPHQVRSTCRPMLDRLEDREVPAAYSFTNGVFTINMVEVPNRLVTVEASRPDRPVIINGRASGGTANYVAGASNGQLMPGQVRRIVVLGSAQNDGIRLAGVDSRAFNNLSGQVLIQGGEGRDTINGTAFDDQIYAGGGDDRVFGLDGNDRIWGEGGNDDIWGDGNASRWDFQGGNDRIDGGSGEDRLNGGGGNDLLIGGGDRDFFDGEGGIDTIWIDGHDYRPAHGWKAEYVFSGYPPQV